MTYTRSDVSFTLSIASQYQENIGAIHWTYIKNILKYVKRTMDTLLASMEVEKS